MEPLDELLIEQDDKMYESVSSRGLVPGFNTFEEAQQLMRGYCKKCRDSEYLDKQRRHKCQRLHDLRLGIVNDYPYWNNNFVRLEIKPGFVGEDFPDRVIACKKFKSKQLKFAFAEG